MFYNIDAKLAANIGLEEAAIVETIKSLVEFNERNMDDRAYKDNFFWAYATYDEWYNNYFMFFGSKKTLIRKFVKLREMNLLIIDEENEKKLKYRVNLEKYYKYTDDKMASSVGQNGNVTRTKWHEDDDNLSLGSGQNGNVTRTKWQRNEDKMATPNKYNKNIINNNINNINHSFNQDININKESARKKVNERVSEDKKSEVEFFKTNFGYEKFNEAEQKELDTWISYAVDICANKQSECIRIGDKQTTTTEFANRLKELRCKHIEYIFKELAKKTTEPSNHKNYILACLYNADERLNRSKLYKGSRVENNAKYQAPTPSYMQERLENLSVSKPKKERIVTAEDERAFQEMLQELKKSKNSA